VHAPPRPQLLPATHPPVLKPLIIIKSGQLTLLNPGLHYLYNIQVYVCRNVKIRRHQHTRIHAHTGPRLYRYTNIHIIIRTIHIHYTRGPEVYILYNLSAALPPAQGAYCVSTQPQGVGDKKEKKTPWRGNDPGARERANCREMASDEEEQDVTKLSLGERKDAGLEIFSTNLAGEISRPKGALHFFVDRSSPSPNNQLRGKCMFCCSSVASTGAIRFAAEHLACWEAGAGLGRQVCERGVWGAGWVSEVVCGGGSGGVWVGWGGVGSGAGRGVYK